MNIFVVDLDPRQAARDLCDQHVAKMHTESVQLLVSLANNLGIKHGVTRKDGGEHKGGYPHHPCCRWLGESIENVEWLLVHAFELTFQHQERFGRTPHSYAQLNTWVGQALPWARRKLPRVRRTPFPQCMPDDCREPDDVVLAYRSYYIEHKSGMARWRHCAEPAWYAEAFQYAGT